MRYHLTPMRMAINKTPKVTSAGKDVEKLEPLHTAGGNVKWCNHYGRHYRVSSKNLKYNCYVIQSSHSSVYIQKNLNHDHREMSALPCSLRHYSQQLTCGITPMFIDR